jgi:hypothetical protein
MITKIWEKYDKIWYLEKFLPHRRFLKTFLGACCSLKSAHNSRVFKYLYKFPRHRKGILLLQINIIHTNPIKGKIAVHV